VAAGLSPGLVSAARAFAVTGGAFVPDPERAAVAEQRFQLYRELYGALRPISEGLG
jgi:sugar (pentulose or hexulose) kinase